MELRTRIWDIEISLRVPSVSPPFLSQWIWKYLPVCQEICVGLLHSIYITGSKFPLHIRFNNHGVLQEVKTFGVKWLGWTKTALVSVELKLCMLSIRGKPYSLLWVESWFHSRKIWVAMPCDLFIHSSFLFFSTPFIHFFLPSLLPSLLSIVYSLYSFHFPSFHLCSSVAEFFLFILPLCYQLMAFLVVSNRPKLWLLWAKENLRKESWEALRISNKGRKPDLGCNLKNARMISVHFHGKPFNITVIHVYAPTTNAKEDEVQQFNEELQDFLELKLFFSSQGPGSQEIPGVIGKFGLGVQNEAGQRLTEFCQENILVIANILFEQHKRWLYTWTSPDGQ